MSIEITIKAVKAEIDAETKLLKKTWPTAKLKVETIDVSKRGIVYLRIFETP